MAGLGAVSTDVFDGYSSDKTHAHCDTLVVGAGPAGLVAARTAAEAGQDVVLSVVTEHLKRGGLCVMASHRPVEIDAPVKKVRLQ